MADFEIDSEFAKFLDEPTATAEPPAKQSTTPEPDYKDDSEFAKFLLEDSGPIEVKTQTPEPGQAAPKKAQGASGTWEPETDPDIPDIDELSNDQLAIIDAVSWRQKRAYQLYPGVAQKMAENGKKAGLKGDELFDYVKEMTDKWVHIEADEDYWKHASRSTGIVDLAKSQGSKIVNDALLSIPKRAGMKTLNPLEVYFASIPQDVRGEVMQDPGRRNAQIGLMALSGTAMLSGFVAPTAVGTKLINSVKLLENLGKGKKIATLVKNALKSGTVFSAASTGQAMIDPELEPSFKNAAESFVMGFILPGLRVPGAKLTGAAKGASVAGETAVAGVASVAKDFVMHKLHGRDWKDLTQEEKDQIAVNAFMLAGGHLGGYMGEGWGLVKKGAKKAGKAGVDVLEKGLSATERALRRKEAFNEQKKELTEAPAAADISELSSREAKLKGKRADLEKEIARLEKIKEPKRKLTKEEQRAEAAFGKKPSTREMMIQANKDMIKDIDAQLERIPSERVKAEKRVEAQKLAYKEQEGKTPTEQIEETEGFQPIEKEKSLVPWEPKDIKGEGFTMKAEDPRTGTKRVYDYKTAQEWEVAADATPKEAREIIKIRTHEGFEQKKAFGERLKQKRLAREKEQAEGKVIDKERADIDRILEEKPKEPLRDKAHDFVVKTQNALKDFKAGLKEFNKENMVSILDRFHGLQKHDMETYMEAGQLKSKSFYKAMETLKKMDNDVLKDLKGGDVAIFEKIYKNVNHYFLARQNKTTSGITENAALENLNYIREKIGEAKFAKLSGIADRLAEFKNNSILDILVDGEVITEKTAQDLKNRYPYYMRSDVLFDFMDAVGRGKNVKEAVSSIDKTFLKEKKGTGLEIKGNVLELSRLEIMQKVQAAMKQRLINDILERTGIVVGEAKYDPKTGKTDLKRAAKGGRVPEGYELKGIAELNTRNNKIYAVPNEVAQAIKGFTPPQAGPFMKAMAAYNKIFRLAATTWNLPFAARNVLRDFYNSLTLDRTGRPMASRLGSMAVGTSHAIADALGIKTELIKEYENGVDMASFSRQVPKQYKVPFRLLDKKQKIVRVGAEAVGNSILLPFKLTQALVGVGEVGIRAGALRDAMKSKDASGKPMFSRAEQKHLARNITVDFQKMGYKMQLLNSVFPFLNAQVQGTYNYYKFAKDKPEVFAQRLAFLYALPYIAQKYWNSQFENDDRIDKTLKGVYWTFNTGKTLKLDNGYDAPILITLKKNELAEYITKFADGVYDLALNKDPKVRDNIQEAGALNTVMTGAVTGMFKEAMGKIPPLLRVGPELMLNRNFYWNAPIVYNDVEPEFQFKASTSNVSRRIGEWQGVSPAKLEHAITGLGPVSKFYMNLANPLFESEDAKYHNYNVSEKGLQKFAKTFSVMHIPEWDPRKGHVREFSEKKQRTRNTINLRMRTLWSDLFKAKGDEEKIDKFKEGYKILVQEAATIYPDNKKWKQVEKRQLEKVLREQSGQENSLMNEIEKMSEADQIEYLLRFGGVK